MQERKIILVDDFSPGAIAAAKQASEINPFAPPPEMTPPSQEVSADQTRIRTEEANGYPIGLKLRSQRDGRIYQVEPSGAFRRITPKPLSKKARRKQINHPR